MPRVSIILPNFNHARYLRQRLDSIIGQTFADWELIILDDASTDDSLAILQSYAQHPQVSHLICSESNSGNTFIQWEKGLQLAQGEYIWIAESDDWAEPQFLAHMVNLLDQHPHAALAFCASQWVDAQGQPIARTQKRPWKSDFCMSGKAFAQQYLLGYNHICNASAVVFRRNANDILSLVKRCQPFRSSGDRLFWLMLALQGDVAYSSPSLNHFRQHACKVSGPAAEQGKNIVEDWHIYQLAKQELHLSTAQQRRICGYHYHAIQASNVSAQGRMIAKQTWRQEPLFGQLSHLVYLIHQAILHLA